MFLLRGVVDHQLHAGTQEGIADLFDSLFHRGQIAADPQPRNLHQLVEILTGVQSLVAQHGPEQTEYPSDFAQRITDEGGSQSADQHDAEAGQVDEERRFLGREKQDDR